MYRALTLGGPARSVEQIDELALCRRIAHGERHLFAQVVSRYSNLVAGAIAAQGVAREDVEDLAQVALVNVYKGLGGFRGEAKLSSWIYRIAINVARAHLKRAAARPPKASIEAEMESGYLPVDEQAGTEPLKLAQARALDMALSRLSRAERETLSLYYFHELSYEEIAEALKMNLNTVRTHIRRGKQRLAELLDLTVLGI
jgi:RNA polymerase sigma-70 factor, ECF subfamily